MRWKILLFIFPTLLYSLEPIVIVQPYGWTYGWGYDMKDVIPEVIDSFSSTIRIEGNKIYFEEKYQFLEGDEATLSNGRFLISYKCMSEYVDFNVGDNILQISEKDIIFIIVSSFDSINTEIEIVGNEIVFTPGLDKVFFSPSVTHAKKLDAVGFHSIDMMLSENTVAYCNLFRLFDSSDRIYKMGEIMGMANPEIYIRFFNRERELDIFPIFIIDSNINSYDFMK